MRKHSLKIWDTKLDDLPAIVAIFYDHYLDTAKKQGFLSSKRIISECIENWINGDDFVSFTVGIDNGHIIAYGCIELDVCPFFEEEEGTGRAIRMVGMRAMCVEKAYRGTYASRYLIDAFLGVAKKYGARLFAADTIVGDKRLVGLWRNLFAKHDFDEMGVIMGRIL